MKTLKMILTIALSAVSLTAFGQSNVIDEVYMTPSQARKLKAKQHARQEAYRRQIEAKRAKIAQEAKEYREQVVDWYNRRDMNVTISPDTVMPSNNRSGRGGYYAQRLKRFDNNDNTIVLNNVDRVYIIDDMDYDPWSDSYYGYDRGNNVSISINHNYGFRGYYGGFNSYWGPYSSYSGFYPWYDWYGPGYYNYYSPWYHYRWHTAYYYGGFYDPWFAFTPAYGPYYYSPWYGGGYYGGYNHGYIDGYGDGSYRARTYSSYARQGSGYYNRNRSNSISDADAYGRALGRNIENMRSGYNQSTRSYNRNNSNRNVITRDWNGGYNSSRSTSTRSTTYNSNSRSSSSSSSGSGYSRSSSGSSKSSGGGYRSGNSRRR